MLPAIAAAVMSAAGALGGSYLQSAATRKANNRNLAMQEEFAKNGVRWKVEDAKAAGIHPLYALGASTMSPSYSVMPEQGIAGGMAQAGQDISRALRATMGEDELSQSIMQEQFKNWQLKNELLGIEVNKAHQPPSIPINFSGVGNEFLSGSQGAGFQIKPVQVEQSSPFDKGRSLGAAPDVGFVYTSDGGLAVVPSKDVKERIEDQLIPEAMWAWRNNITPMFNGITKPNIREFPLPLGYDWKWNFKKQGFYPEKIPGAGVTYPTHRTMPNSGEYRRY